MCILMIGPWVGSLRTTGMRCVYVLLLDCSAASQLLKVIVWLSSEKVNTSTFVLGQLIEPVYLAVYLSPASNEIEYHASLRWHHLHFNNVGQKSPDNLSFYSTSAQCCPNCISLSCLRRRSSYPVHRKKQVLLTFRGILPRILYFFFCSFFYVKLLYFSFVNFTDDIITCYLWRTVSARVRKKNQLATSAKRHQSTSLQLTTTSTIRLSTSSMES